MAKKRLKLKDKQGNVIDYDISAASVTIDAEGKSVQVKIAELVAAIAEAVKTVVYNGEQHIVNNGRVDIGNQMQSDWSESSQSYPTFIKNKPNVVTGIKVGASGSTITPTNGVVTLPESGSQPECDTAMSSTSEAPVQNKVIKAYVDSLINGLINGAPQALDTLKELADALSDNDDAVAALTTLIGTKQDALISGTNIKTVNNESILGSGNINIADGADGITPHIGQNGNWYIGSTDTNVKAEGEQGDSGVASADGIAVRNNTTGGYTDTEEQVNVLHANVGKLLQDEIDDLEEDFSSGIIDMHVTGDTLYITTDRSRPWIRTNRSAISFGETLSGGTGKTYRVTLTWKNLTNIISVAFKSGSDTAFTKTISSIAYVDGGRHSADIDIVFAPESGATGAKAGTLVLTSGNITVEVDLSGTAATVVVPTLSVSEDELNFSAMQGQTADSQSFDVTGDNLTADATVSVSGTGVEISSDNSTFGTSAITLQRDNNGSVNATIYVRYTAGSSNVSGSVTISSTGADSVSVDVAGTVVELPSGYTKVFGITPQTSGAYIDTGFSLEPYDTKAQRAALKFQIFTDNLKDNMTSAYMGSMIDSNFRVTKENKVLRYRAFVDNSGNTVELNEATVNAFVLSEHLYCIEIGCGDQQIPYMKDANGTAIGQLSAGINNGYNQPGNISLFKNKGSSTDVYGTAHISRFKVWDENGLKLEFVACKDSNNVYGMYEKLGTYDGVVGKFFASASEQVFTEVQQPNS